MGVQRDAENPAEPLHREFIRIKKEGCGAAAYQTGRLPSILTGKLRAKICRKLKSVVGFELSRIRSRNLKKDLTYLAMSSIEIVDVVDKDMMTETLQCSCLLDVAPVDIGKSMEDRIGGRRVMGEQTERRMGRVIWGVSFEWGWSSSGPSVWAVRVRENIPTRPKQRLHFRTRSVPENASEKAAKCR
ncbi:hypothetical protein C8R44DRAFT_742633 [Mycena epipterygia]|nr:hypothetical protein C8R44DRAFT_742633 [Mycena epipterygia]